MAKIDNNIESFMPTWVKTIPPFFLLSGVKTATTALCNGPLIPPIIIIKKPGIIYALSLIHISEPTRPS